MKLRIRGNSVRLRLTKTEVADLVRLGSVEESAQVGPGPAGRFRYRLEARSDLGSAESLLTPLSLVVAVPASAAARWASGEDVGIYSETDWGLKIAVEKDFRCLDRSRPEDDADAYDNPAGGGHPACDAAMPEDLPARA